MWLRKNSGREITSEVDQVVSQNKAGGDLREEIVQVLASLPEKKRQAVILCYLDGVSRKNASRFLGLPEATLRKRLYDAKRLIQKRIVEVAEKNLEEHLLPRGFENRCICACKRALDAKKRR
jgi:RNA polymerase sigma factor (sigma-70 family)